MERCILEDNEFSSLQIREIEDEAQLLLSLLGIVMQKLICFQCHHGNKHQMLKEIILELMCVPVLFWNN